jgi:uncharacterized protein
MDKTKSQILELDGRTLYYSFLAGAQSLMEHQKELNKINVFPVPDADTGTNLSSTIRSIIENVKPEKSFKKTIDSIADAALIGARGNSGVIFAQFFYGLSAETQKLGKVDMQQFAQTVKKSITYIYEAISNPVEGTMLTVMREWADFVHQNRNTHDFTDMFQNSYLVAKKSLLSTKERLKVLAKANVVDAGAKGFVVFLEGIIELLKNRNLRKVFDVRHQVVEFDESVLVTHDEFVYRYCTEAVIRGHDIDQLALRKLLSRFGDSVVVAGAGSVNRIHVHTDDPAELFHQLKDFGTMSYQKADDMKKQFEIAHNRKFPIALVTDSTCDLPQEFLDKYQIHMVNLNLNFGENHYLDKLTISPAQFYDLTDDFPEFPTTSQPNERTFINLYSHLSSQYESIIAVHLTGRFSGTLRNSQTAAEKVYKEFGKRISVIDSKSLSGALGLVVARIAKAIEENKAHEEIVQQAEKWIGNTRIFVSVKDFKYMVRGGRVSPLKGKIARLLNIKPVISMDKNGNSLLLDKAFSQKGNIKKVMKHVRQIFDKQGIHNYILLHARNENTALWIGEQMQNLTGKPPLGMIDISPVIGLSAGRGAVAVAFDFG